MHGIVGATPPLAFRRTTYDLLRLALRKEEKSLAVGATPLGHIGVVALSKLLFRNCYRVPTASPTMAVTDGGKAGKIAADLFRRRQNRRCSMGFHLEVPGG